MTRLIAAYEWQPQPVAKSVRKSATAKLREGQLVARSQSIADKMDVCSRLVIMVWGYCMTLFYWKEDE